MTKLFDKQSRSGVARERTPIEGVDVVRQPYFESVAAQLTDTDLVGEDTDLVGEDTDVAGTDTEASETGVETVEHDEFEHDESDDDHLDPLADEQLSNDEPLSNREIADHLRDLTDEVDHLRGCIDQLLDLLEAQSQVADDVDLLFDRIGVTDRRVQRVEDAVGDRYDGPRRRAEDDA